MISVEWTAKADWYTRGHEQGDTLAKKVFQI